jgi:DNA-damage-inducible protein D
MTLATEQIKALKNSFELRKRTHMGQEVWSARDLQDLFGYRHWSTFRNVIFKAMNAMETSGVDPDKHFTQIEELVDRDSGGRRPRENFFMSRAGAYMLALETDSKEYEAAAFARTYFSAQTRSAELAQLKSQIEADERDLDRLDARGKLSVEERGMQDALWGAGINGAGIANIREEGNKAFFGGYSTEDIRWRLGIGGTKRSPADFLSTPIVLAKALIASLTKKKIAEDGEHGQLRIAQTHVQHSQHVRKALVDSGVAPEKSEPQEDIRLVAKRVKSRKKVSSRAEALPTIYVGESRVISMSPSLQQGQHPPLFELD